MSKTSSPNEGLNAAAKGDFRRDSLGRVLDDTRSSDGHGALWFRANPHGIPEAAQERAVLHALGGRYPRTVAEYQEARRVAAALTPQDLYRSAAEAVRARTVSYAATENLSVWAEASQNHELVAQFEDLEWPGEEPRVDDMTRSHWDRVAAFNYVLRRARRAVKRTQALDAQRLELGGEALGIEP